MKGLWSFLMQKPGPKVYLPKNSDDVLKDKIRTWGMNFIEVGYPVRLKDGVHVSGVTLMNNNTSKRDFDKEATTWETLPRIKLADDVVGAMLKKIRISSEMDVLDFGCGTGLIARQLAPHVRSVTGVDTSKGMLEVLKNKVNENHLNNVKIVHLTSANGEILFGQYHLIISSMTLHHVEDVKRLLENFYRSLQPGGYVAIADLDQEDGRFHDNNDGVFHFGFDRPALSGLFKQVGFIDVCCVPAACMNRLASDGQERAFSLFLITGRRH